MKIGARTTVVSVIRRSLYTRLYAQFFFALRSIRFLSWKSLLSSFICAIVKLFQRNIHSFPASEHEVLFFSLNLAETRNVREIISEFSFDLPNVHLFGSFTKFVHWRNNKINIRYQAFCSFRKKIEKKNKRNEENITL